MVGNILLGNDSYDVTLVDNRSYIIEFTAQFIRKSDDNNSIKISCLVSEFI